MSDVLSINSVQRMLREVWAEQPGLQASCTCAVQKSYCEELVSLRNHLLCQHETKREGSGS